MRRKISVKRKCYIADRKTVVVGNLHSGGSGKTPLVAAIAEEFADFQPVIVSRGYRASLTRVGARVESIGQDGPEKFGDEPWMLFKRLGIPVFIGRHRAEILARAQSETQGKLFLLDDAYQNFSFRHDVDIVAISTDRALEESFCLPLGDLREPLSALQAASGVVLLKGAYFESWAAFLRAQFPALPFFEANLRVEGVWGSEGEVTKLGNLSWGAFCGIARPEGFRNSLKGLKPAFLAVYEDHHKYDRANVDFILSEKARLGLHHLITTEKDWHKAYPLFHGRGEELYYLRIGYVFSEGFWYFLRSRLENP